MNAADGMSDEELDVWADVFYQAKVGGVTEVTFSQFISNPFTHLGLVIHTTDRTEKEKPRLRLVYSKGTTQNPCPSNGTE